MQKLFAKEKIMLVECVNCGFYVDSNEKLCLDCGLSEPDEPVDITANNAEHHLTVITGAAAAIIILGGIIIFRRHEGIEDFSDLPFLIITSLLFGLLIALFANMIIFRLAAKNENRRRFAPTQVNLTLQSIEDTVSMRRIELELKQREFKGSMKKRGMSGGAAVKSPLTAARNLIASLISRYRLLGDQVDFVRLQNHLLPFAERQNAFNESESVEFDEISAALDGMFFNLEDDLSGENSEPLKTERQEFLARIIAERNRIEVISRRTSQYLLEGDFDRTDDEKLDFSARKLIEKLAESLAELERGVEKTTK